MKNSVYSPFFTDFIKTVSGAFSKLQKPLGHPSQFFYPDGNLTRKKGELRRSDAIKITSVVRHPQAQELWA